MIPIDILRYAHDDDGCMHTCVLLRLAQLAHERLKIFVMRLKSRITKKRVFESLDVFGVFIHL